MKTNRLLDSETHTDLYPEKIKTDKIWNPLFTTVFVANIIMNLGLQMTNAIISKYADHLGSTATITGLVTSIFAVTALIFKLVSGPAIDTYNKKYILMFSMCILMIAQIGYCFSGTIPLLILFRLIQGAGLAFSVTCALALAADALPPEKFGTGIGYFSLGQVVAQALGPTIGLLLLELVGYNTTFIIGAAVMFSGILAATRIRATHTTTKKLVINLKSVIAKEAVLPALIMFLLTVAYYTINSFLVIYANGRGVGAGIGTFFTVYAVTMLFTRPLIGKLSDRYGTVKVLIPALLCFALSFLIISYSASLPSFLIAAVVSACGYGASQPAIQSLSMKCVAKERRGSASSTNYIGNDLGTLIGPVAAGAVAELTGYAAMWRIMIAPMLLAMVLLLIYHGKIQNIEKNFQSLQ
ncbi:MFS transporter [Diplocloster agilis]|uniref:MFS transporter n=1 Tax=Diplocloster agilis TaxID=2850323 RepID=UPI00130E8419|nr:MFS transporter [Suonthocola fibrivorans]MCU6736143.1 MFS transporter [Suonthocola fibrivorans]